MVISFFKNVLFDGKERRETTGTLIISENSFYELDRLAIYIVLESEYREKC